MLDRKKKEELERERINRSQRLADEVKDGNYIPPGINMMESFFPNRGKIQKDKKAMARLYGDDVDKG